MGKTGGGRGTNQYRVKGRSVASSSSGASRFRHQRSESTVKWTEYRAVEFDALAFPSAHQIGIDSLRPASPERAIARYVLCRGTLVCHRRRATR